jgi:alcohol dehydrogenase class IV
MMKKLVDLESPLLRPLYLSVPASTVMEEMPHELHGIQPPAVDVPASAIPRIWDSSDSSAYFDRLGVRSIFLVADDQAYARSGAELMLKRAMHSRHVFRFSDFTANPKSNEIDRAVRAFRSDRFDLIVAVGGGSAMDVAKLARACNREDAAAADVIQRRVPVQTVSVPLLAIPTTAGTGAEATHFSAVYVEGRKYSLGDPSMRPQYVILNEKLLESLPRQITLQTGLDATCQAIESTWSTRSTPASRQFAARALRLAWSALPVCLGNPTPRSLRMMLNAAHLAGRAIDISQTTACHALSYSLTSHFNVPHGLAVALMLGPVWSFNAGVTDEDIADARGVAHVRKMMHRLAHFMGASSVEDAAAVIRARLIDTGAAVDFSDCHIPKQQAIELIAREVDPLRAGNNPRKMSADQVAAILQPLAG